MNETTVTLKVVVVGQLHSGNVTTDLVVVNLTPIVRHFGCGNNKKNHVVFLDFLAHLEQKKFEVFFTFKISQPIPFVD